MADFSFLSDTDDSAVDELISQAHDLCVLDQVSAINCSSFTDSPLPSHLESRFRNLKSLPLSKPVSISSTSLNFNLHDPPSIVSPSKHTPTGKVNSTDFSTEKGTFSPLTGSPVRRRGLNEKSKHDCDSSLNKSNSSAESDEIPSLSKIKPDANRERKATSGSEPFSSPFNSSNSFTSSPSPPRKSGCFWCSPKKGSHKKNKENRLMENGLAWSKNDDFLSDLRIFSIKEQQKMLKKALKEEQELSREAEKIVRWAKQASARMSDVGIEDELSDDGSKI